MSPLPHYHEFSFDFHVILDVFNIDITVINEIGNTKNNASQLHLGTFLRASGS